jgi:hypothetical protein
LPLLIQVKRLNFPSTETFYKLNKHNNQVQLVMYVIRELRYHIPSQTWKKYLQWTYKKKKSTKW